MSCFSDNGQASSDAQTTSEGATTEQATSGSTSTSTSGSSGCDTDGCETTTDDPRCVAPGEEPCLVPSEKFTTVQQAVTYPYCAEVVIAPGTYVENIIVDRDVTIMSRCPGDVTLDGGGGLGATITVDNGLVDDGHDVVLRNLVITGGYSDRGGGVSNDNQGALALVQTVVEENRARLGGGVFHRSGKLTLEGAELRGNIAELTDASDDPDGEGIVGGGGLYSSSGSVDLIGESVISGNTVSSSLSGASLSGGGVSAFGSALSIREGSAITSNKVEVITAGEARAVGGGVACEQLTAGLLIEDALVADNLITGRGASDTLDFRGGGLWVKGTEAVVSRTLVSGNTVSFDFEGMDTWTARGGGLFMEGGSTIVKVVTITESTFIGNAARAVMGEVGGGGLFVEADGDDELKLVLVRSTFTDNQVESDTLATGAGIEVRALAAMSSVTLSAHNSTLSGNQALASDGGGIAKGGGLLARIVSIGASVTVELSNVTIAENSAVSFGGGVRLEGSSGLMVRLRNTVIAGNMSAGGADCSGDLSSAGNNLIGDSLGCGDGFLATDQLDEDPLLGPLGDNGGPTQTHALTAESPAIDGGPVTNCADENSVSFELDQRREPRKIGMRCDVGAYEYQP